MWIKAENSDNQKPAAVSIDASGVIITRNWKKVEATDERPEHWEYEEWQMSHEQYEVYLTMKAEMADTEDALIELAGMIEEVING